MLSRRLFLDNFNQNKSGISFKITSIIIPSGEGRGVITSSASLVDLFKRIYFTVKISAVPLLEIRIRIYLFNKNVYQGYFKG